MSSSTSAAWFEDRIAASVAPLLPGFAVEAVAEIDSTNTELMRRARAGRIEPVLLVAERQTAGRGRLGRPWQSAPQQEESASLTFSLGLPLAPADWSGLSLAVGVSVAESLDPLGAHKVGLKWPNDVWVNDCKLVGILIETALPSAGRTDAPRYLVIGIGIKCCANWPSRWCATCSNSRPGASRPLPSALQHATCCGAAKWCSATAPPACAKAWPGAASCRCAPTPACS
jgi:BirA family biotin operon repressor/biotin-[acetyl-CoA-carboxylase] ligase